MAAGRGGPAAPGAPASPPGGGRAEEPKSALETRSGLLGTPKFRGSFSTNPPPQKKASLGILLIKNMGLFFFVGCMQGGREGRPGRPAPPPGGGRGEEPKSALESRSGPGPPRRPRSPGVLPSLMLTNHTNGLNGLLPSICTLSTHGFTCVPMISFTLAVRKNNNYPHNHYEGREGDKL